MYAKDLDLFDQAYMREGRKLRRAIARIISLARADRKDPYGAVKRWLEGKPAAPPPS